MKSGVYARMRGGYGFIVYIIGAMIVAGVIILAMNDGTGGGGGLLVAVTYPSLEEDLAQIMCDSDRVVGLYRPGADPHDLQLDPEKASIVARADIVVTGGHTPVDVKAGELAGGVVVDVLDSPGIRILYLPGDGPNTHYPIYDPENYRAFITHVAGVLEKARPSCSYTGNAERILKDLSDLDVFKDVLAGKPAVIDLPAAQYPAEWLGAQVVLVLAQGYGHVGEAISPGDLEEAERQLAQGAIAFVTVDSRGTPVSKAGDWLLGKARELGARVVLVKAPYMRGTVPEKLGYIAGQMGGLG